MWILIVIILSSTGVNTFTVKFKSEKACVRAADEIGQIEYALNRDIPFRVDTFCEKEK